MKPSTLSPQCTSPGAAVYRLAPVARHVGITARGQRYASMGVPGTGVSWREYERKPAPRQCDLCQPGHAHIHGFALVCLGGLLLGLLLWFER